MADWLSATWGANWRSFQYFNLYRLVLALLLLLALVFPNTWVIRLNLLPSTGLFALIVGYLLLATGGLLMATRWQVHFNKQLSAQIMVDIFVVSVLLLLAGGVGSGL